jgi:methionine synthase II (cobalamin-independent)
MNAASPGVISEFLKNRYYDSDEEYLYALADAMKHEYEAIVGAGFLPQLDCPDLAMGRHLHVPLLEVEGFRKQVEERVEVINHATRDIPPERMRLHVCWGNYESPHHHDVPWPTSSTSSSAPGRPTCSSRPPTPATNTSGASSRMWRCLRARCSYPA